MSFYAAYCLQSHRWAAQIYTPKYTCFCDCKIWPEAFCWFLECFGWTLAVFHKTYVQWESHCIIISASLTINVIERKRSSYWLVAYPLCRSVGPESVLWQHGWLDLDAVLGGEWGRPRDVCIRWGDDRRRGRGSVGVSLGCPIVATGYSIA